VVYNDERGPKILLTSKCLGDDENELVCERERCRILARRRVQGPLYRLERSLCALRDYDNPAGNGCCLVASQGDKI
jgi:hypothetical protein